MEFLSLAFSSPLKDLNGILALLNLVLALHFLFNIISDKNSEKLVKFKNGIDSMLLICLFMILFVILDVYGLWQKELVLMAQAKFGADLGNISSFLTTLFFHLLIISFFLITWFTLRMLVLKKIERIQKI